MISIVMPVKNGADRIERAINSVAAQEWPHELIVVDGMSADGTADIIAKRASDIAISIRAPDGSATEAVNRGAGRASGEIICMLMSDDWLETGALAHVGEMFAEDSSTDIVAGGVRIIDEMSPIERPAQSIPGDEMKLDLDRILGTPYPAAFFFKRALWNALDGLSPVYRYGADRDLLMRCKLADARCVSIPEFVYAYSINPGSDTLVENPSVITAFLVDHYAMVESWLASPVPTPAERRRLKSWRREQVMELAARYAQAGDWGGAWRFVAAQSKADPAQITVGAAWFTRNLFKALALRFQTGHRRSFEEQQRLPTQDQTGRE